MRMLTAPRAVPAGFTGSGTMQAIALRAFRESRDTARSRAGACASLQYLDRAEAAQCGAHRRARQYVVREYAAEMEGTSDPAGVEYA